MKTREEEYCTLRDETVKRGRTESGTPTRGRPTEQGLSLGSRAGGGGEGGGGGFNRGERRIPMMKEVKDFGVKRKPPAVFPPVLQLLSFSQVFSF